MVTKHNNETDQALLTVLAEVKARGLLDGLHDKALVEGIEDILAFEESRYRRIKPAENICVSAPLREVVKLMDASISMAG